MTDRVPMGAPDIRDEDIEAVVQVLRSGTLSLGPSIRRFEEAFADYIGVPHAIAVSSGTAALHLCVRAAGIAAGDEIVTTPFSYIASANCALFEGATPVFVDIDEETMTIDPDLAAAAVTERTRALLPVHVFGQPCNMDPLAAICAEGGLALIEDACEAIGAEYRGRKVGTFGDSAVFSFFPNKQMTTGEGAIVTTGDEATASLLRSLRNQGRDERGAWLTHARLGYNYRMTELSAALGLSQIGRIEEMLAQREKVAGLYRERLGSIRGTRLIEPAAWTTRLSWFAAVVRLDPGIARDDVIEELAALGIPARAYFSPLHLQPFYRSRFGYCEGAFPVTERVARATLALPFHNGLTEEQVDMVCGALEKVLPRAPG
jgi:perosamine synthetase